MGYALTYFKGIPHGLANGCLYKEYLKIFKDRKKVDKIYELLGFDSQNDFDVMIEKLAHVFVSVSIEELEMWSKDFSGNEAKLKNHPEDVTYDEIFNIYKNSLMK